MAEPGVAPSPLRLRSGMVPRAVRLAEGIGVPDPDTVARVLEAIERLDGTSHAWRQALSRLWTAPAPDPGCETDRELLVHAALRHDLPWIQWVAAGPPAAGGPEAGATATGATDPTSPGGPTNPDVAAARDLLAAWHAQNRARRTGSDVQEGGGKVAALALADPALATAVSRILARARPEGWTSGHEPALPSGPALALVLRHPREATRRRALSALDGVPSGASVARTVTASPVRPTAPVSDRLAALEAGLRDPHGEAGRRLVTAVQAALSPERTLTERLQAVWPDVVRGYLREAELEGRDLTPSLLAVLETRARAPRWPGGVARPTAYARTVAAVALDASRAVAQEAVQVPIPELQAALLHGLATGAQPPALVRVLRTLDEAQLRATVAGVPGTVMITGRGLWAVQEWLLQMLLRDTGTPEQRRAVALGLRDRRAAFSPDQVAGVALALALDPVVVYAARVAEVPGLATVPELGAALEVALPATSLERLRLDRARVQGLAGPDLGAALAALNPHLVATTVADLAPWQFTGLERAHLAPLLVHPDRAVRVWPRAGWPRSAPPGSRRPGTRPGRCQRSITGRIRRGRRDPRGPRRGPGAGRVRPPRPSRASGQSSGPRHRAAESLGPRAGGGRATPCAGHAAGPSATG